eukprot:scaffold953_cov141-Cylindrotheca_fusiformis.AAC.9
MEDADVSGEVPFTPVRSSSDTSGITSNASVANDASVVSGVASTQVPPSPQRSYQTSATSSPSSVNRSVTNSSPVPATRTPVQRTPASVPPMQPDLQTPLFGGVEVGDLLGDYSEQQQPQAHHYAPQTRHTEPRVLYDSDDEDTDPTSSLTATGSEHPAYTRHDATSTFGKVVQPFKHRVINSPKRADSTDDEGEDNIPSGAIIFGYLQKQGRNGKWQTRWFESDGESLAYFKSSKRTKLLATLDLTKVGMIRINSQDSKGCSFTINISQRPYHLRADSKESCKDWVITLNRIKEARLQQGNVKLVNSQPPDLLDDNSVAPRVVVVSGRQRTHAVDDEDMVNWEDTNWNDNPANDDTELQNASSAKWQKSKSKLAKLASKVLRWARSIRQYNCNDIENQVYLDHHVHPPGHDYSRHRSRTNSSNKEIQMGNAHKGQQRGGTSIGSEASNPSLVISRTMSLDDARVLS